VTFERRKEKKELASGGQGLSPCTHFRFLAELIPLLSLRL